MCGGGAGSQQTYDPVFNQGMLDLSQEQQGWAAEMFNMFKYGVPYDPSEKVQGYYDESGSWVEKGSATASGGNAPTGSSAAFMSADSTCRKLDCVKTALCETTETNKVRAASFNHATRVLCSRSSMKVMHNSMTNPAISNLIEGSYLSMAA